MICNMKALKKLFLTVSIILSLVCSSYAQLKVHQDNIGTNYVWNLSNAPCYGCGSFYVSVWDDPQVGVNGYYTFYVYAWSNSYFGTGLAANSYISDINIYYLDMSGRQSHILGPFYKIATPKKVGFDGYSVVAILYSTDPKQIIHITWGQIMSY